MYVVKNILVDGKWGELFEALCMMLLYPELQVNIRVISSGMGGTNMQPHYVEVMNVGHVLQQFYDEQHHDCAFEQFLTYDIVTCEQLYLLLGIHCCPFAQVTPTFPHNHYCFLKKKDIAGIISKDAFIVDTPWVLATDGRLLTKPQKHERQVDNQS
jgi:hypothetical protein